METDVNETACYCIDLMECGFYLNVAWCKNGTLKSSHYADTVTNGRQVLLCIELLLLTVENVSTSQCRFYLGVMNCWLANSIALCVWSANEKIVYHVKCISVY